MVKMFLTGNHDGTELFDAPGKNMLVSQLASATSESIIMILLCSSVVLILTHYFWVTYGAPANIKVSEQKNSEQLAGETRKKKNEANTDDGQVLEKSNAMNNRQSTSKAAPTATTVAADRPATETSTRKEDAGDDKPGSAENKWRCSCEGGLFLPNNLLKSFGGAEAVFRMGSGDCYHKQV
jgi:hypothetical protein